MTGKKILRIAQTLQLEELPGGEWRAYYPGEDWSVTAPTRAEAYKKVVAEREVRTQAPDYHQKRMQMGRRHLNEPIDGLEVEEIDEDAYAARMRDLPDIAEDIVRSLPADVRAARDEAERS